MIPNDERGHSHLAEDLLRKQILIFVVQVVVLGFVWVVFLTYSIISSVTGCSIITSHLFLK